MKPSPVSSIVRGDSKVVYTGKGNISALETGTTKVIKCHYKMVIVT